MFGSYLWFFPRAFFTHGGRGCERHPAFPAPSLFWRAQRLAALGQIMPRECERMFGCLK